MSIYKIEIKDPKAMEDPLVNLGLNMMGGLLPENLSKEEVNLLIERIGENWFEEMGYSEEKGFKKPAH